MTIEQDPELQDELATDEGVPLPGVVVASPLMKRLYHTAARLGSSDIAVLVTGETGSGKEHVAQAIHAGSKRSRAKMVTLNCAALNANLVESQLFGHTAGAFSGAVRAQPGLVEAASGSTLFLDEIGELPLPAQAKLLRVLQSQHVRRVGATDEQPVDIRVVAATNRNLTAEVAAGSFRMDLYYRLAAATLHVPPLRDRPEEVLPLASAFVALMSRGTGRTPLALSAGAERLFTSYLWPGNVRELRNVVQYLVATTPGDEISEDDARARLRVESLQASYAVESTREPERPADFRPLHEEIRELEVLRIRQALHVTNGNQTHAARLLQVPIRTMCEKVKKYKLLNAAKYNGNV